MKRIAIAAAIVGAAAAAGLAWSAQLSAEQDARFRIAGPQIEVLRRGGSSIGVTIRDVTSEDVAKAKLDGPRGVVIETVQEETPASRAGLRGGDIVLEYDSERVRSVQQFTRLVKETPTGRSVRTVVVRDGARQTLDVTPEQRAERIIRDLISRRVDRDVLRNVERVPRNFGFNFDSLAPEIRSLISPRQLGATLTPLSEQMETYFGVSNGVLVSSVQAESAAAAAGLRAGDVITQVNGRRVEGPNDVTQAIGNAGPGATIDLTVTREKKEVTLKARIPDPRGSRRGSVPL